MPSGSALDLEKRLRKRFSGLDMATIRDVARRAGVSVSTVSHVINGTRVVLPETKSRVLEAMQALNYTPNRLARSLRNRQTATIGVLLPNSANPYFAEVLLGIETACFDLGYNVIIGNAIDDPEREQLYLKVLLSRQVDGVILISTGAYQESLELLRAYNTPFVLVDRASMLPDSDEIVTDNYVGGALATRYLLDLGHTRIGCITVPSTLTPSADRVTGYYDTLRSAGITPDPALILAGDFQPESGYAACQKLLRLKDPPTAIFACNDLMAIGALRAIHEAGASVPDDISLVGYDDIPLASFIVSTLTTVAQPSRELGQMAVRRLVQRLQNPELPAERSVLPVSLVVRDSCRSLIGASV